MKIILQKQDSRFDWETPKVIDEAQNGIEQFWRKNSPERAENEARQLIAEIERKVSDCLWIITAGCCLGGKEGALVFDRLDKALDEIKDFALGLGETKFER
ncbi:MAG: hypothetical protein HYV67_03685 [Candidatus Taylorbacteria bacterium]|nr:hypothetical protein [Candidatus Taylorbacteria bacterium]